MPSKQEMMMTWLDEIRERQAKKYISQWKNTEIELISMDKAIDDGERMARVIRVLVKYIKGLPHIWVDADLPDDVKELLS